MRLLKALHETERFSTTELPIVQYLLDHSRDIAHMTIRDLADATFTSPATVFRLCQKLGLSGYRAFKFKFTSEVNRVSLDQQHRVHRPITSDDSPLEVMQKIAALKIEAIEETKNEINLEQLIRVANCLIKSKQIDIYAYDQNQMLAQTAVYNFQQLQHRASAQMAMTTQISQAMNSDGTTCAILISRSGLNQRLVRTARLLKKQGAKTIVFTSYPNSKLVSICDEYCYVANTREYLDMGGIIFSTGLCYYIEVLCGIILAGNYDECEAFYNNIIKVQGDNDDKDSLW